MRSTAWRETQLGHGDLPLLGCKSSPAQKSSASWSRNHCWKLCRSVRKCSFDHPMLWKSCTICILHPRGTFEDTPSSSHLSGTYRQTYSTYWINHAYLITVVPSFTNKRLNPYFTKYWNSKQPHKNSPQVNSRPTWKCILSVSCSSMWMFGLPCLWKFGRSQ